MTHASATRTPKRLLDIPGRTLFEEQAMAMIVALTSEIAVLRARLDAFERLSGAAGGVAPDQIDAFIPDAAAEAERAAQRQRLLRRVFRSLGEGGASTSSSATSSSEGRDHDQ